MYQHPVGNDVGLWVELKSRFRVAERVAIDFEVSTNRE